MKSTRRIVSAVRYAALIIGVFAFTGLLACIPVPVSVPTPEPTPTHSPGPAPATMPKLLLPDLQATAPIELYIQLDAGINMRELWFSTTVINTGDGPLEMVGIYDEQLNRTRAVQRIMTEQGVYEERVAGFFIFHESHDHWHFEDFAELEIFPYDSLESSDEPIATTGKVTFCIYDMARLPSPPLNSPEDAVYTECDPVIQGISVGWTDTYESKLPGQQLNIGNLPDGPYMIRATANPAGLILERDESNNSSIIYVEITGIEISIIRPPSRTPHNQN